LFPVLLIPVAADSWSSEQRRLVLFHELAHIRRWDWLTQMLAHVACALYWCNPLVWVAARQMRIEREGV
jgi:beta-lactamase regulating signal transducer with metallopeptidase domain